MNCFFTRRIPLSLLCRGLRVPVSSCFAITLPLPIPPIHSFIHSLPYPLEKELENAFDSSYDSVFFTSPTHYFMSKVLKNFSFCLLPPPLLPPLHTHTHYPSGLRSHLPLPVCVRVSPPSSEQISVIPFFSASFVDGASVFYHTHQLSLLTCC